MAYHLSGLTLEMESFFYSTDHFKQFFCSLEFASLVWLSVQHYLKQVLLSHLPFLDPEGNSGFG